MLIMRFFYVNNAFVLKMPQNAFLINVDQPGCDARPILEHFTYFKFVKSNFWQIRQLGSVLPIVSRIRIGLDKWARISIWPQKWASIRICPSTYADMERFVYLPVTWLQSIRICPWHDCKYLYLPPIDIASTYQYLLSICLCPKYNGEAHTPPPICML